MTISDTTIHQKAPAKINLTLHLTGLRDDGYHLLESLVVFTEFGDTLTVDQAVDLKLIVDGQFADGVPTDDRNLVLKAANLLRSQRNVAAGATIHLTKNLPHGAGIGGGSSDAAAALTALAKLWGVAPLSPHDALTLGADVPVCLCAPHATVMRGIGENLSRAPYNPEGWLVLVNPNVVVPTSTVFALHDRLYDFTPASLDPMDHVNDAASFEAWLLGQRNDLTKVASEPSIAPVIQDVLNALRPHAVDCDMSGSGSTCWGLFHTEDAAKACAEHIAHGNSGWWVRASRILA
ncbi:4-(cytidine 5'-diphospho)-2-C-methyl-D-erythritol kinase [Octadecabacter sp. G9-8]|uniref:4-diphosphocytidyl-2-C-methyl-D-erythritol kinase n=1 Tax=Octadecabacter dasysiphoniae TaxID=2909341 RepID=A0ABS9CVF7_9RHOB|nr:4-(cytidine 5'-diphospho)-2-C-methyl-D-erythritol kinase [Octadecabacter dasysiphoniae]MCF2871219.1 4-(cytidine 5'-diphospho)-2-C-methyl-D-erythritol kinase [Octadecabacter dasysiphoniae]